MTKEKTKKLKKMDFKEGLNKGKNWVADNKGILIAVLLAAAIVGVAYALRSQVIVATVNGKAIYRWELIRKLEKEGGEQVLDSLVTEKLVKQQAQETGTQITEPEINAYLENLRSNLQNQGQDLDTLMEEQSISRHELRDQIEFQLTLEKLAGEINVSEEEIDELYEQQKDMLGESVTEEDARAGIREQLRSQKLNTEISEIINNLKEKANISKLLKF